MEQLNSNNKLAFIKESCDIGLTFVTKIEGIVNDVITINNRVQLEIISKAANIIIARSGNEKGVFGVAHKYGKAVRGYSELLASSMSLSDEFKKRVKNNVEIVDTLIARTKVNFDLVPLATDGNENLTDADRAALSEAAGNFSRFRKDFIFGLKECYGKYKDPTTTAIFKEIGQAWEDFGNTSAADTATLNSLLQAVGINIQEISDEVESLMRTFKSDVNDIGAATVDTDIAGTPTTI